MKLPNLFATSQRAATGDRDEKETRYVLIIEIIHLARSSQVKRKMLKQCVKSEWRGWRRGNAASPIVNPVTVSQSFSFRPCLARVANFFDGDRTRLNHVRYCKAATH